MKKFNVLLYFIKEFLFLIFIMTGLRGLFLFINFNANSNLNNSLIFRSFLYGSIFDISISSYYLIGLTLFFALSRILNILNLNILKKFILNFYKIFMSAMIFFLILSDIKYYKDFNSHLNSSVFDYTSNLHEIYLTLLADRLYIFLLITFFIIEIFYLIISFKWGKKLEKKLLPRNSLFKSKVSFFKKIKNFILEGLFYLLIIIFLIFGARGGFSQGTLNWGRAYFSENYFANQMSLNAVFTLFKSLDIDRKEQKKSAKEIDFTFSEEEIKENIRNYIKTSEDKFLSDKNVILREVDPKTLERKFNVVIVLMESFMSDTVGALGGVPDTTPHYNKLSKEGLLFSNFYSNGNRSNRGIVSVLTGFPSQYGHAIIKKPVGQKPFLSLSSILKKRGYNTSFIYGGDIEFDNMKGFLSLNGIDNIISKKDFPVKERTIKWGVPDDKVFEFTSKYLDSLKEPFFTEVFTLSNHAPFDIPYSFNKFNEKEYEDYKRYNAFLFSDYAIGKFVDLVRNKKWAQNTVFVFVADHGEHRGEKVEIDWKKFTNPLLIWTPGGQIKNGIFEKLGSQVDLLPTLMEILGGRYIHSSWGKNLFLEESKNDFVYVIEHGFLGLIDNENIFLKNMETGEYLTRRKSDNKKINISKELEEKYKKALNTYYELTIRQEKNASFGNVK